MATRCPSFSFTTIGQKLDACIPDCSRASKCLGRTWERLDKLRHNEALVAGTQVTGGLGLGSIATWGTYLANTSFTAPAFFHSALAIVTPYVPAVPAAVSSVAASLTPSVPAALSTAASCFSPLVPTVVQTALATTTPLAVPVALTAATLALAKFYGGADGAMKVFTDYLPQSLALTRSCLKFAPKATETGVWKGAGITTRWSQFFDPRLASVLADVLREEGMKSAWDFGCGQDQYSPVIEGNGVTSCNGLDGNPAMVRAVYVQDLAVPFKREKRDCVISLEVGAKIPEGNEDQFLQNINAHADKLAIISWPVEGQRGPNQVNRRSNEHIIAKMEALGWKQDVALSQRLRDGSHPILFWSKNTLMAFRRKAD